MARVRQMLLVATLLAGCQSAGPVDDSTSGLMNGWRRVRVEYDYMTGHDPDPQSLQLVIDAFAAHRIDLEIAPQHDEIPASLLTFGACVGQPGTVDFYELKKQYFEHDDAPGYHYAIFADRFVDKKRCTASTASGISEVPGTDIIISLADVRSRLPAESYPILEGGVFMHELGHNLGLHHGGGDQVNFKPNYLSVMNYRYQGGVPFAAAPGDAMLLDKRLDYSAVVLPTLDEAQLDERAGFGGTGAEVAFFTNGLSVDAIAATQGPVDFDGSGGIDEAVAVDLTGDGAYQTLEGFDDWSHLDTKTLRPVGYDRRPMSTTVE